MRPIVLALAAALLAVGCAAPVVLPPDLSQAPTEQLQAEVRDISRETQKLLRLQDEKVWKHWTEGEPLDLEATYRGKETLFSPRAVQAATVLRSRTTDPTEQRALTHLENHLTGESLSRALSEPGTAVARAEETATYAVEGEEHAFRDLDRRLANEKNTELRRKHYAAATAVYRQLEPTLRARAERLEVAVRELGFPSVDACGRALRGGDLDALAVAAGRLLDATSAPYKAVMGRLAQSELGIPFEKLTQADLPRLFRPKGVDADFPKAGLLPRVEATLAGLGVELRKTKGLTLELGDGAKKNPRPLELAIELPATCACR